MKDTCTQCGTDLTRAKEIHAVEGEHFCSADCAVTYRINELITNAKEIAKEWYSSNAEVVTPVDIGLVHEKIWTTYNSGDDVTVIFRSIFLDKEGEECLSTEIIGFYWGEPNEADTEKYTGCLKAEY